MLHEINAAELLYYAFLKYKNTYSNHLRTQMISDIKTCVKIIDFIDGIRKPDLDWINDICKLMSGLSHYSGIGLSCDCAIIVDYRDDRVTKDIRSVLKKITLLAVCPWYRKNETRIKNMFRMIHNMPRVLIESLAYEQGNVLFHMSYEEACVSRHGTPSC